MDMKDAKKTAEKTADLVAVRGRRPMRALHRWGVRSDHAYLAGFVAVALALVAHLFRGAQRDEHGSTGILRTELYSKAAPLLFLIGLGLEREG